MEWPCFSGSTEVGLSELALQIFVDFKYIFGKGRFQNSTQSEKTEFTSIFPRNSLEEVQRGLPAKISYGGVLAVEKRPLLDPKAR